MPQIWECDRCERTFTPLDDMRSRAGDFTERVDGTLERYEQICEDCHRELVRS